MTLAIISMYAIVAALLFVALVTAMAGEAMRDGETLRLFGAAFAFAIGWPVLFFAVLVGGTWDWIKSL